MSFTPADYGVQNGVTGRFTLSGSTVTVTVSDTSLAWRINGTKSGGDHGTYYIDENWNEKGSFEAEDGHKYAFQVCSRSGTYSDGFIFTVNLGDVDDDEPDSGSSSSTTIVGFTAKDIYFGDRVSITWTPPSSSFSYQIKFKIGSNDLYTTDVISPKRTTPYTYTDYSLPLSFASHYPNSDTGSITVKLTQYTNSSATQTIGSSVVTSFVAKLGDNVIPSIISCSAQLDNSENSTVASWGIGLVGYSKIKLLATAKGEYGAEIKNFTITGDYSTNISSSSLDYTGDIITTSGNKSFTITCTDSRGRTSSAVMTNLIEIQPYTKPKVTAISYDKNAQGYLTATAIWEYTQIGGLNSTTATASYRMSSSSDWTNYTGSVRNNTPFTISAISLDNEASYNIRVIVTDAVGNSAEKSTFASTTKVLLDFKAGGNGLGIGKICENDGMEVSMDAKFYEGVYVRKESDLLSLEDYIKSVVSAESVLQTAYPVGGIYISLDSRNPEVILGFGKWSQICGRFLLGAGVNEANTVNDFGSMSAGVINRGVGEMGGEVFHGLTVDEMPRHRHGGVRRRNVGEASNGSTGTSSGDGSTTYDTDYTGGDAPHNNMPPYLAVYMWKRVS